MNLKFGEKASQQRLQGPALVCHVGIRSFANINLHYNIKVDHWRAVLLVVNHSQIYPWAGFVLDWSAACSQTGSSSAWFPYSKSTHLCLCSLACKSYSSANSLLSSARAVFVVIGLPCMRGGFYTFCSEFIRTIGGHYIPCQQEQTTTG